MNYYFKNDMLYLLCQCASISITEYLIIITIIIQCYAVPSALILSTVLTQTKRELQRGSEYE